MVAGREDGSSCPVISGYLCDVWTEVAGRLGLQYELTVFNSSDYGTRLDNGTWTGMIGLAASNVSRRVDHPPYGYRIFSRQ